MKYDPVNIPPVIYQLIPHYLKHCKDHNYNSTPKNWERFLKSCGLEHLYLSRVKIKNKKKWFLAKIKYGI